MARQENLWVIDTSLARSYPINSAFIGLFSLNLFRIDIFQMFFPPRADLPAARQIRITTTETRRKDKKEEILSNLIPHAGPNLTKLALLWSQTGDVMAVDVFKYSIMKLTPGFLQ